MKLQKRIENWERRYNFKIRTFLAIVLSVSLLVFLVSTLWRLETAVCERDVSMQPPHPLSDTQKKSSVYLISYADLKDIFFQNRNMLARSAVNSGIDFIYNYRREHLDPAFIKANPILQESYGAGYWLWKPYIILETLRKIPEGSILLYADSGLFFSKPIRNYIEKGLSDPGKDVLLFAYDPKEYGLAAKVASGDTFDAIHCRENRCRYGHHVWAGIVVVRNSPKSRHFIETWLNLCRNTDLLQGKTKSANYPEFRGQQHDEGILSALGARESDVVNFMPMDSVFFQHIEMHRRKNMEFSLLPEAKKAKINRTKLKIKKFFNRFFEKETK